MKKQRAAAYDPVKEAERIVTFYDPRPRHPAVRFQMEEQERRAVSYRGRWRTIGLIAGFIAFFIGAWYLTPDKAPVGVTCWLVAVGIVIAFELVGQRVYRKRSPW